MLAKPLRAQTDTVATYSELQLYNGTADTLFVSHPRYHGLFAVDTCTTTNFGTRLLANGTCWQRIHHNFSPRFWELNGLTIHSSIGPVLTEVEAVNTASYFAWLAGGDTVLIDSMFEIDRPLRLYKNVTWLGTADSVGFVRAIPPKTVLTDTAHVGQSFIKVQSNAGFRSLQQINIASNPAYDSIAGFASYTAGVNPVITGDTLIFLSGDNIQKQMLPGDSVSLFFSMMRNVEGNSDSIHLENLVFDGRRNHYTLNYDWRVNQTMLSGSNSGAAMHNCRFNNMPAENLFLCGTDITDCAGSGFNGSALHFSCSNNGKPTEVLYNRFSGLNQVGDSIMSHSEGAFTFSSKVRNFRIAYNSLAAAEEVGIGWLAADDTSNFITDNWIESAKGNFGFFVSHTDAANNVLYNNKNPFLADTLADTCAIQQPNVLGALPCNSGSNMATPLQLGDTITIALDSLLLRNSNNNYAKQLIAQHDATHFRLVGASLQTQTLVPYHRWQFDAASSALVFDNGHRNGMYGAGNWGYEGCGEPGGCTQLAFSFAVDSLPLLAQEMACPLTAVQVVYDGELGTYSEAPLCVNAPILLDSATLGRPVLTGRCAAPVLKRSDQHTDSTARLVWETVPIASGYRVWYKPVGGNSWQKVPKSTNQGRKLLTGLSANTQYQWRVQARCESAWGPLSSVRLFETQLDSCLPIDSSALAVGPVQADRARLNWLPIASAAGYTLQWRVQGDSLWNQRAKDASKSRHWLTGLTPNTVYEWRMRSLCQNANNVLPLAWSPTQTFTTATASNKIGQEVGGSGHAVPSLTLLPSATTGDVLLYLPVAKPLQVQLTIYNTSGRKVHNQSLYIEGSATAKKLNVGMLPAGLYFVHVQGEELHAVERLVIVR